MQNGRSEDADHDEDESKCSLGSDAEIFLTTNYLFVLIELLFR